MPGSCRDGCSRLVAERREQDIITLALLRINPRELCPRLPKDTQRLQKSIFQEEFEPNLDLVFPPGRIFGVL
jgi:hypothetical protein